MKLKEKLASEYDVQSFNQPEVECYLAGFEKAREMVLALFQSPYTRGALETLVENLGEEEVE